MRTLQVTFTKTKHVDYESLVHWGSLNQHSNSLVSSCSALIPLCFLMHWPGMWCYFITEAEATSSVSSLRALATLLDMGTVRNHSWMAEADKLSCLWKIQIKKEETLESGARTWAHISERSLKGLDRKNRNKYCIKDLSSTMDPDDNELGIFTVIQWVIVCCGLLFCAYFVIQSDLIIHNHYVSSGWMHWWWLLCKESWFLGPYA